MAKTAITMRELQKMSARAIRNLPHSMPIKSGTETVGLLTPLKKANIAELEQLEDEIAAAAALRSPEENEALDAWLDARERGEDPPIPDILAGKKTVRRKVAAE